MTQINQYTDTIGVLGGDNQLNNDTLFDVDQTLDGGGTYVSAKMSWGTLQTYLGGVGGGNWGNTDLTVTDVARVHNGNGNTVAEINLFNRIFAMEDADGSGNGFLIERAPTVPTPQLNENFVIIQNGHGARFKIMDDGALANFGGDFQSHFLGDSSLPGSPVGPANQPNRNYIFAVAGSNRKSIFTDQQIPDEAGLPLGNDPFDSIVHFKSNLKGVLFPNLTTAQRAAIPTPRTGLVIFNTDSAKLQVYSGVGLTGWQNMN